MHCGCNVSFSMKFSGGACIVLSVLSIAPVLFCLLLLLLVAAAHSNLGTHISLEIQRIQKKKERKRIFFFIFTAAHNSGNFPLAPFIQIHSVQTRFCYVVNGFIKCLLCKCRFYFSSIFFFVGTKKMLN